MMNVFPLRIPGRTRRDFREYVTVVIGARVKSNQSSTFQQKRVNFPQSVTTHGKFVFASRYVIRVTLECDAAYIPVLCLLLV